MSLKRLKEITHTTSVRLTLWYTFLFTAGALLLFGLSFLQFRAGVMQLVRELIRVHAESYAAAYRQGGEKGLRQAFDKEGERDKKFYILRVVSPEHRVLYVYRPDPSSEYDFRPLDHPSKGFQWSRLADVHEKEPYEFAVLRMPDQSLLQVGRSIAIQEDSIERFQRIFLGTLLPIVLLSFGAGAWLTSRTLKPVRQLITSVQAILRTGQMSERVPPGKAHDELQQLVFLFNQMLEKNEKLIGGPPHWKRG